MKYYVVVYERDLSFADKEENKINYAKIVLKREYLRCKREYEKGKN